MNEQINEMNENIKEISSVKLGQIFSNKSKEFDIMLKDRMLDDYNSSNLKELIYNPISSNKNNSNENEQQRKISQKKQIYLNKNIDSTITIGESLGYSQLKFLKNKYGIRKENLVQTTFDINGYKNLDDENVVKEGKIDIYFKIFLFI